MTAFSRQRNDGKRFLWDIGLLCLCKTSLMGHTRTCWSAQLPQSPAEGSWAFPGDLRAQPIPMAPAALELTGSTSKTKTDKAVYNAEAPNITRIFSE